MIITAFSFKVNDEHKITKDFKEIHDKILLKYNLEQAAANDVKVAAEMEQILRYLKMKGAPNTEIANRAREDIGIDKALAEQCDLIFNMTLNGLNSNGFALKSLFSTTHSEQYEASKNFGVDDIVEAEIAAVLASLDKLANQKSNDSIMLSNIDILKNTTGRIKGSLPDFLSDLQSEVIDNLSDNVVKKINDNKNNNESYGYLKKIYASLNKKSSGKSIKTDVSSIITITGEIDENLEKLVKIFSGRRFTIKNYNSQAKTGGEIHLGNTVPYKAITGELTNLGFSNSESVHVFYHSLNSYIRSTTKTVAEHIPHIRLAYELEGNGLVDSETKLPILGADFLIVNDPKKYQIYVRSTKQIIADLIDSSNSKVSANPFGEDIILHYSYLNKNYKTDY